LAAKTLLARHGRLALGSICHPYHYHSVRLAPDSKNFGERTMKIFGVSLFTIALLGVAYFIGAKYPGPANRIMGGM
jgi:hypothetical protein